MIKLTDINRAANHINAVELDDGRWAHYDDTMSRWYIVSADELAELCDYLDDDDVQIRSDAYSHWSAGSLAQEMPDDWTPETADQFVILEEMPDHLRGSHRAAGNWGVYPHNGSTRSLVHHNYAEAVIASDADNYAHTV